MSWRDAMITLKGVRLREEDGLRMLGQIIIDLLSDKQPNINNFWLLPYDTLANEHAATKARLIEKQLEHKRLNELKQKQQNGSN